MDIGAMGVYLSLFLALYFEVFLLISFFEKKPSTKTAARPTRYPEVAVLVPCWNKASTLGPTIESLLALDYPKEKLSILIIDDGSTDNTYEVALRFAHHPRVTVFQKRNEGSKYSALNYGLARTQSELVGCLDADSFVAPDSLLEIVKHFEADAETMAVAPAMKVNRPYNVLELMQAVEYTFGIFYKKMFDNIGAISVLPGPFSFYRRSLFDRIGGFRRAYHTEDMEMAFRMQSRGLKIANVHTALVYTNVPSSLGALVRQRTRWSRGFLENSRDYKYMYFNPKYGNFGLLVLPFGLSAFMLALYVAGFMLYTTTALVLNKALDLYTTGVPPHLPTSYNIEWFYINTNTMLFVTIAMLLFTVVAITLGSRIAKTQLGLKHFASYFMLFGLVAPLWLARATWDALLSRERGWLI